MIIIKSFIRLVINSVKSIHFVLINLYMSIQCYVLYREFYKIILVVYLVFMIGFTLLSVIVGLYFMIDCLLLIFNIDVFTELSIEYNMDNVYDSDISDIIDITDISDIFNLFDLYDIYDIMDILDLADYISFVSIDMVQEKSFLCQYFDEFVKLFRKDSVSNVKVIHLNDYLYKYNFGLNDNLGIKDQSTNIEIEREVLRCEVEQLKRQIVICEDESRVDEEYLQRAYNTLDEYRRAYHVKLRQNSELVTRNSELESQNNFLRENFWSNTQLSINIDITY